MTTAFDSRGAADRTHARAVRSGDGVFQFHLQRVDAGLYVRREVRRPRAGRVTQAVIVPSLPAFRRWRDADSLRFEYPILHAELMRAADDLFALHEFGAAAV